MLLETSNLTKREQNSHQRTRSQKEKLAELPSLYSDTEYQIFINYNGSRQALAVLYVLCFFSYWRTDETIRTMSHKCFAYNYEGGWKTVQDYLETKFQTPKEFEQKYISDFGPHDFFGNFLPLSAKLTRNIRVLQPKSGKVNKPIRRRGYKDKGSRRLPHENHGIPGKEKPLFSVEREDRRNNIRINPLLEINLNSIIGDDSKLLIQGKEEPKL